MIKISIIILSKSQNAKKKHILRRVALDWKVGGEGVIELYKQLI